MDLLNHSIGLNKSNRGTLKKMLASVQPAQPHRERRRLGAGVHPCHTIVAGHLAELTRAFADDLVLEAKRPRITRHHLHHCVAHEARVVTEDDRAEAATNVDDFIAVGVDHM